MGFLFDLGPRPSLPVRGHQERFTVGRIFCVGRNYAAHAREMGNDPDREPPFFFSKPADCVVENGIDVPYPPRTQNLHHEIELVLALGRGGAGVPTSEAHHLIFGCAVGNDLTRRDLQADAKDHGRPWDTAKGFDFSAPVSEIVPVAANGLPTKGSIRLAVNGVERQRGDLADMIWSVPEIVAVLSTLYTLRPGDLIFTGTPSGVGPVVRGDLMEGEIDGLGQLTNRIG